MKLVVSLVQFLEQSGIVVTMIIMMSDVGVREAVKNVLADFVR